MQCSTLCCCVGGAMADAVERTVHAIERLAEDFKRMRLPFFDLSNAKPNCSYIYTEGERKGEFPSKRGWDRTTRLPPIWHYHHEDGKEVEYQADGMDVLNKRASLILCKKSLKTFDLCFGTTQQPLNDTPLLYKGRPSLGFEVRVTRVARWSGTVFVGITTDPVDEPYRMLNRPHTVTRGTSAIRTAGRSFESDRRVRSTEVGDRFAMMIHYDVMPPVLAFYHNGEECKTTEGPVDAHFVLAELYPKFRDMTSLPSETLHSSTGGTLTVRQPIYGCVEVYAQADALEMCYDEIDAIPLHFDVRMFASYSEQIRDAIKTLFLLRQRECIVSLLPVEVLFEVCNFVVNQ